MATNPASVPTISRILGDRTMIELVFDPVDRSTALAVCDAFGERTIRGAFAAPSGETLVPYPPTNNIIANGCVLLPSAVGEDVEKAVLVGEVQGFVRRFVDLPPTFEALAAHYILLTWVYDAFSDLPYLRFRGDFGTGKTRSLLTIGSLCYKPFFASGASTVSPIFHIQDAFQGTLILDEADFRFSDTTAQLAKVLNNGTTRGMPVLRTMTNRNRELNPQAFHVFGPKIVAMREHFADQALESRFLTAETSGRTPRAEVPVHLPDSFASDALALRNKLLAWRFRSRFSVGPDPSRLSGAVAPRYRQTSLALLSLVDDASLREEIGRELAAEEARVLQERADTLEATMLAAVIASLNASTLSYATVNDIAARFNAKAAEDLGRSMTNKWVGGILRRRLRLATMKSDGVYVVPRTELKRATALARRYGVTEAA